MDNQNLIPLRVMGLSYNQLQNGAYALLLAQEDGPYRIPVVIGAPEAQSIAISLERIVTPRPLTHDLFATFAHAFGVRLERVYIYRFEDGIFSSELTFTDGQRTVTLDARTSDAIALAMRSHAPIFTNQEVLDETGFIIEEPTDIAAPEGYDADDDDTATEQPAGSDGRATQSIDEMERELQRLIDAEAYEEAALLKKRIEERKGLADNTEID
ncbi:MAG: bifunctional nuclease family protein [Muribaculaceae bacterium]|nr:bifunctional nuclease family protein [Muribaculaceae bacterium]